MRKSPNLVGSSLGKRKLELYLLNQFNRLCLDKLFRDMATMDKEGRIRLVGRTKEMIIRGGENIYPKEIEELLHRHDAVQDVFVSQNDFKAYLIIINNIPFVQICGVPDNRMGEEICAWIKLNDAAPKLTVDDIRSFCKEQVSLFNTSIDFYSFLKLFWRNFVFQGNAEQSDAFPFYTPKQRQNQKF